MSASRRPLHDPFAAPRTAIRKPGTFPGRRGIYLEGAPVRMMRSVFHIPLLQNPEEYKRIVESQREWVRSVAQHIEDGSPLELDELQRKMIAGLLRLWADNLPDKPKGKQGPRPKFDPGSEAIVYAIARAAKGKTHGQAVAAIADRVGASETAVAKGIKKHRAAAFNFINRADPDNQ